MILSYNMVQNPQYYIFAFFIGAVFGSFANVLIYRTPKGISIINPPSSCPKCNNRIKWYDNIPLLSYILLIGKCRYCGQKIPFRYFLVELLTAILFLIASFQSHNYLTVISLCSLYFYLVVVTFIDLENRIIPDKINFGFLIYSIIFYILTELIRDSPLPVVGRTGLISVLVGIASITGFFLTIDLISILIFKKPGIGYGDIKMGLNLGIYLGFYAPLVPLLAYIMGGFLSCFIKSKYADGYIPFAPFLSIASLITTIFGSKIVSWYVNISGLNKLF